MAACLSAARGRTRPSAAVMTLCALWLLAANVAATALTVRMSPNEKACFFAETKEAGQKIGYYFAVQSGGSFDINYEIRGPGEKLIADGLAERQGDLIFTANTAGEYRFCLDNEMSSVTDKVVDFEIVVENEERAALPAKQGATEEQTGLLAESIYKINSQLSTIGRNQKYFRTRENRNFSTVRSTEQRIFRFSVIENLFMVGMAALQVFIVRFFFTGARKGYV